MTETSASTPNESLVMSLNETERKSLRGLAAHFLRCDYAGFMKADHDFAKRIMEETK